MVIKLIFFFPNIIYTQSRDMIHWNIWNEIISLKRHVLSLEYTVTELNKFHRQILVKQI